MGPLRERRRAVELCLGWLAWEGDFGSGTEEGRREVKSLEGFSTLEELCPADTTRALRPSLVTGKGVRTFMGEELKSLGLPRTRIGSPAAQWVLESVSSTVGSISPSTQ